MWQGVAMGVLGWIVGGLIVGLISQFLVKGPHNLGCIGTIVLGIVGSLVGGTLWGAMRNSGFELQAGGFFASLFGAVVLLVLARLFNPADRR